ncbi:MAG: GNAT family N-acetyltransferase [Anaerolineae bacterium]
MQIEPLRPEHAAAAAALHYQGQQHTFLGRMGVPFLTALYRELANSPWGFGLVAVEDGQAIGVATAAWNTRKLFLDLIVRRSWRLLGPTLAALWRDPSLVRSTLETLAYPWKARPAGEQVVELLFLGVHEDWRGRGIGSRLTEERVRECQRRGYRVVDCMVEADNEVSKRLHLRHGFRVHKTITLYGREMIVYRLSL